MTNIQESVQNVTNQSVDCRNQSQAKKFKIWHANNKRTLIGRGIQQGYRKRC